MRDTKGVTSEANIVLAECFFDGRARSDLQTYLSFFDPDAEVDSSRVVRPYSGVYRGREQIETLFREQKAPWRYVKYETANPVAAGDRVVIDVTRTTRAWGGPSVLSALTAALTVRAGKIVSFKVFQKRADALTAAGMAE